LPGGSQLEAGQDDRACRHPDQGRQLLRRQPQREADERHESQPQPALADEVRDQAPTQVGVLTVSDVEGPE
jgi:hypothetical protein